MERASLLPTVPAHPTAPTDHDLTDAAPSSQGHASSGTRDPRPEPSPQCHTDKTHLNNTTHD